MKTLNIKKFGFAIGVTGALLYLGCILIMLIAGHDGTVAFFNSVLHGLDTSTIIIMKISWWKALIGLVETFIIGWLTGASIAFFYNLTNKK
ncbi:MAG: hypothetical protein GXO83_00375 [Chlorobi bacterium]|nr:hypothetical protein [Chlorobiota bacterium]